MRSPSEPSPPPGCPAHDAGRRTPLYTQEFAKDPQGHYDYLRGFGPVAPVELAPGVDASLVTDYAVALQVLQSPDTFVRDSRRWRALNEGRVPLDSPVLPMMAYRPGPLFEDGARHLRLRQAVTDSLVKLDTHQLTRMVERTATYLISQFSGRGKVDLIGDYARLVPLLVFNDLFGCPGDLGDRVAFGISGIFDGTDAQSANDVLVEALLELVALKRAQPGDDILTHLLQHPAGLSDEEMIPQLIQLIGGGFEPMSNLIGNALRVLLSQGTQDDGPQGVILVEDAINDVLWNSCPIANYATHFPLYDVELSGSRLNAGDPVLISFAAANSDPSLSAGRGTVSRRAHLAWGAGPHACPAKDPAMIIAVQAIEKLLNELPDIEMSVDPEALVYRPGPFHRALGALPARFTPVRSTRPRTGAGPAPVHATAGRPAQAAPAAAPKGKFWSGFLSWWKG
ncbi:MULTISPECIES: cytochrome P450 [unclassified Streptomyces]|uniref:cytochrome P450 n=1 Tax=unclassified Streptomyces TaxID=2593676 RepID=UPI002E0F5BFF|nr:cytochrome P450 [Streptomyces sp. NBC_01197]WSS52297.1 cytochrome P450 [Streptomyces sp. NBC_01180]